MARARATTDEEGERAAGDASRGGGAPAGIGQLREGPLHRALKAWAADDGAAFEVRVDGYVVDVRRGDGELIEVQTGSFSPLRAKLDALLDRHRVRIVHPVPAERRIVRVDDNGVVVSQRPSP